jgi:hypothetical protein
VLRVQCRRNSSGQCNNSSGHNRSLKPNALRDLRSNNGRKANVLVVQPNDRSRKRSLNSRVRRKNSKDLPEEAHRLNAAAVAKENPVNPVNPVNRSHTKRHGW